MDAVSDGDFAIVFETMAQMRAAGSRKLEREGLLAESERVRRDAGLAREELQRAAESLASSKAQYCALRTSLDGAFCVIEMFYDERGAAVDYRFLEMNPVITTHTGHLDPVGRTARELVPELDDQRVQLYAGLAASGEPVRSVSQSPAMGRWFDVMERWTRSIATGVAFEMTFPLRRADGTFQTFLTRVGPSRDAAGHVVRWFGTNANIEHEPQLWLAAVQANRAKSKFPAVMSHELRTPKNAIDGYAELMEPGMHGPVTAEQRHDLARIRRSERHLLGLINGVLHNKQV